jgi:uncharacterized membrane protein YGL010W
MDPLKDHVYLAAWLALPIAALVAFIQNKKVETKAESFSLKKKLAYFSISYLIPDVGLSCHSRRNSDFIGVLAIGLLIAI